MNELELTITELAAGGDGVGRDATGRVTFVPLTVPGDRVRVRIVQAKSSFARAELVEILEPGADRVTPACPHVAEGCGGCAWQQVARPAQLAAKQAIVEGALRGLDLTIHPVADPAPALGWRRRARFHVRGGRTGLFAHGSQRVVPIARCPQLEPALEAARAVVAAATPPDGELALLLAHDGRVVVATERPWRGADRVAGRGGITRDPVVEVDPGVAIGAWDFAQASTAGNAALVARVCEAVGPGPGVLVELHAGAGNLTRALAAAGWDVRPSDVVRPAHPPANFEVAEARAVLAKLAPGGAQALVLDPPRTGAAEAIDGILAMAPPLIAYVSCDPATLARDLRRLIAGGYRATDAWPIDLMPQTAHVEVVVRLVSARAAAPDR